MPFLHPVGIRFQSLPLLAVLALACSPEPTMYQLEPASLNKGGGKGGGGGTSSDLTVSKTSPSSGHQGQSLMVRVSGSGFDGSAVAAWERNGAPDPGVQVRATRFLSSTELEVDIDIAVDAQIDLYDVSVTLSSGKRGIGIERFEVLSGHVLTVEGDLGPLLTNSNQPVTFRSARKPFNNLTLRNVKVTIGQVATLSGDGEFCRTRFPNRQVDNDWDEGVRGDWVGEMVIWQDANNTSRSNMRFLGVRPEGGSTELQFTVNTHFAQQTSSGGTTTLRFIDAPLSFGAGPNRYVPRDGSGTPILYCINVTIEAAPIP